MIIIVDSGSTKSDWVVLSASNNQKEVSTMGFNPYFHNEQFIASEIRKNETLKRCGDKVKQVYFYGAGASTKELCAIVQRGLKSVFINANIHVGHDLDACAYATYRGQPAISCIIGTGSNSCYFDGKKVREEVPALAYILGDEGSGSYYGKQLLSKFLYKQLPDHLHKDFYNQYGLDKDQIIEHVYFKPHANVYIASFSKFISRHSDDPFIVDMVSEGMHRFLSTHVLCYPDARQVKTHFIGSLAYHFEHILRKVAADLDLKIGNVVKKPIDGLVNYHLKYLRVFQTQGLNGATV